MLKNWKRRYYRVPYPDIFNWYFPLRLFRGY